MRIVALVLTLLASSDAFAQGHCYIYGVDSVELFGVLTRRVFTGPPMYESSKGGNHPDTVWVLRLEQSMCVNASPEFKARQRVREVQLVVNETDHGQMRTYMDRKAMFRGKLRGAELGGHHLPVVFWAQLVLVDLKS